MIDRTLIEAARDRERMIAAEFSRVWQDTEADPLRRASSLSLAMSSSYAAEVLQDLLSPRVPTYVKHDDHEHDPADGADGRDAHAS